MSIVKFWLGGHQADVSNEKAGPELVPAALRSTLCDHLCINSTAVITLTRKGAKVSTCPRIHSAGSAWCCAPVPRARLPQEIKGSKTEGAGLFFVESLGFSPLTLREAAFQRPAQSSGQPPQEEDTAAPRVIKQYAFSSDRKMMVSALVSWSWSARCLSARCFTYLAAPFLQSTVVELRRGGPVRVYTTGGSDFILAICEKVERLMSGETGGTSSSSSLVVEPLTKASADAITSDVIVTMARQSLRTIGLAYRDFESVAALPVGWQESPEGLECALTLYGILGIKDPLREVGLGICSCCILSPLALYVSSDAPTLFFVLLCRT